VSHRQQVRQADWMNLSSAVTVRMAMDHISDEWLLEYSQGDLEEPRMGKVEEHLLICEQCRRRVIAFDEYRKLDRAGEDSLDDRNALHPN
jgi:anti-sigma factor RsiW